MNFIGGVTVFFTVLFLRVFVVVLGWGWFIVPFGVEPIGYAHALGISVFIGLLTHEGYKTNNSFKDAAIEASIRLSLVLFFMWVASQFM